MSRLVLLLLAGCTQTPDSFQLPPPGGQPDFDLQLPTHAVRGEALPMQIVIPPGGRQGGYNVHVVVADGGPGAVCTATGDCLDVTGAFTVLGPLGVRDGLAASAWQTPMDAPDQVEVQAVRLRPGGVPFVSDVVLLPVHDPCLADGAEPDSRPDEAGFASLPSSATGTVCASEFVVVSLAAGELLRVDAAFAQDDGDVDVFVYDLDATSKYDWLAASYTADDDEDLRFVAPETGDYLVRTTLYAEGTDAVQGATYTLDLAVGGLPDEDLDGDGCADADDRHVAIPSPDTDGDGIGDDCDVYGDIAGIWSGTVTQGASTYPVELRLGRDAESGALMGRSLYPSLGCDLELRRLSESDGTYVVSEAAGAVCAAVTLELTLDPSTGLLDYGAYLSGSTPAAVATLSRAAVTDALAGRWGSGDDTLIVEASGTTSVVAGSCVDDALLLPSGPLVATAYGTCPGIRAYAYDPVADALVVVGDPSTVLHRQRHAGFGGSWTGTFVEPSGNAYPVEVDLYLDAAGDEIGVVRYPTLSCADDAPLLWVAESTLGLEVFEQHTVFGCVPGNVDITWDPVADTLDYDWYTTGGVFAGAAVLTR
jgi:hypothetical protein